MARKPKPLTLYFTSLDDLEKTKAEYDFIGREVDVDRKGLRLTVLTVPKNSRNKKQNKTMKNNSDNQSSDY